MKGLQIAIIGLQILNGTINVISEQLDILTCAESDNILSGAVTNLLPSSFGFR